MSPALWVSGTGRHSSTMDTEGHGGTTSSLPHRAAAYRRRPKPLEVPGVQKISLKMHEFEIEFGYSFGF